MPAGRFIIPIQVLEKFPNETVDILRLGACANALNSLASMAVFTHSAGVGRDRDALQVSLMVLSYLKEATDILDQTRLWDLIRKAVDGGLKLPQPVEFYRELFSRGRKSIYRQYLHNARNQKGFHIGSEHFEEWRSTVQAPELTIWQRDSDSPLDWAFTLSMQIQSFYGAKLGGEYDTTKVIGHGLQLGFLVEALCAGLMVEAGGTVWSGWQRTRYFRVRIEYEFRDGRDPLTERDIITVQGQRIGASSIAPLRARFLAGAGAISTEEQTGYVLNPANGALVMFSAGGRATAHVWLEEEVLPEKGRGEPELLARFANTAMWGERQALQALKLVEAVRSGGDARGVAESLMTELADSLQFWQREQKAADDFAKGRREKPGSQGGDSHGSPDGEPPTD